MGEAPLKWSATLLAVVLAVGCSSGRKMRLEPDNVANVDLSGSWELNYQLSEQVQEQMELLLLIARRHAYRSPGYFDRQSLSLPSLDLIRLAEAVSRTTVLEIEQSDDRIEIDRGEDFALTCSFEPGSSRAGSDPLGAEVCGWDDHQLIFAYQFPEGLHVRYRLTAGPRGENLNVATTVRRRGAGEEFTLNRVYTRFEPLPDEYDCRRMVDGTRSCRRLPSSSPPAPTP